MKTIKIISTVSLALLSFCSISVRATEKDESVVYLGSGSAKGGDSKTVSTKKPITFGYLRLSNTSDRVWGMDISSEGTMLNSTWGQDNEVKQATSFNLLVGTNLGKTENSRFDTALILGMREKSKSCPPSNLGYQCYADSKPNTSYGFNSGLALTWTYKSALLGLRATGESTQFLAGIRF